MLEVLDLRASVIDVEFLPLSSLVHAAEQSVMESFAKVSTEFWETLPRLEALDFSVISLLGSTGTVPLKKCKNLFSN